MQELLTVFGLSDCIRIIYFYPQLPSKVLCPEPGSCSVQPPLALGSVWLQRAVISQPALLSSSNDITHSDYIKHREEAFIYACFLLTASAVSVYNTHANPTAGTGLSFA